MEGSGRHRSVRCEGNIDEVSLMILSQEDEPGTHETPARIFRENGSDTSVR